MKEANDLFVSLLDVIYTQDTGNLVATADVVVDGKIIASELPITYLLFLEKQLTDILSVINKLPIMDEADEWTYDENRGCYVTEPTVSNRTKKVPRILVKAEATDKHPAQVEVYHEDVKIGEWSATKLSSAIPADKKKAMVARVVALQDAVKVAREKANSTEIEQKKVGENILKYING
jgi:hypothetical protein